MNNNNTQNKRAWKRETEKKQMTIMNVRTGIKEKDNTDDNWYRHTVWKRNYSSMNYEEIFLNKKTASYPS
jgi:hypothetical protein